VSLVRATLEWLELTNDETILLREIHFWLTLAKFVGYLRAFWVDAYLMFTAILLFIRS